MGSECKSYKRDSYCNAAQSYFKTLEKFECVPKDLKVVYENAEPTQFWKLFGLEERPKIPEVYCTNKNWGNWFIDFNEESRGRSERSQRSKFAYAEREELEDKPALFIYPYHNEPLYVLDLDDLESHSLVLLCDKSLNKCYVWKGVFFKELTGIDRLSTEDFIMLVNEVFFENELTNSTQVVIEDSTNESDEFLAYFN